jgi:DMSO/TMAO reductase YedYZ molybdopterin-dependent catalytic subunit
LLTGRADGAHANRLPPGRKEVKSWPVLDLGLQPSIEPENWRLRLNGRVGNPLAWSLPEFMTLPQQECLSDIHCVTAWSRYDNHWTGVSARTLLEIVQPKADARDVIFHAHDTYTTKVKLDVLPDPACCSRVPGRASRCRENTAGQFGW